MHSELREIVLDELADALVGFYLSRRLCRRRLDDWALTAIAIIIY